MVKIKHFQYRTILETDFLSNEGENEVRFLLEERNFQAYFLPNWRNLGRILFQLGEYWRYILRETRENLMSIFAKMGENPVYIFTKQKRVLSPVAPPLQLSLSCARQEEIKTKNLHLSIGAGMLPFIHGD